jgi:pilus assembly protein Flp/PilA
VETGNQRKDNPMRKFFEAAVDFVKREDGPTAVEYAVMLALIIVVCLAAITTLGQNANTTFTTVGTKIGSASS